MYFLVIEDPHIMMTLRREILDIVGPGKPVPTFDQIKEMKYMRAVANGQLQRTWLTMLVFMADVQLSSETLRLMPSVPG